MDSQLSEALFIILGVAAYIGMMIFAALKAETQEPRPHQVKAERKRQLAQYELNRAIAETPWRAWAEEAGLRYGFDGSHHVVEGPFLGRPLSVHYPQAGATNPLALGHPKARVRYDFGSVDANLLAQLWAQAPVGLRDHSKAPEHRSGRVSLSVEAPPDTQAAFWADLRAWLTALHRAHYAPWFDLAERNDWPLNLNDEGLPRISALHRDRPLQISLEQVRGQLRTRIFTLVDAELPPLRLLHIDHGKGPGAELNHAIAGSLLWGEADDEQALRRLLAHPPAFQAIMGVAHAFPTSEVRHDRIILLAPGDLGDALESAIDAVVDAAIAIPLAPR